MTNLGQEIDQLFINYFSNLDLKAIVADFHHPCTFIVPRGEVDPVSWTGMTQNQVY